MDTNIHGLRVIVQGDGAYFARRAEEEKLAASEAASMVARDTHLDMAARYEELASAIAAQDRRNGAGIDGAAASA